jgi:hypothetical protein
MNQILKDKIEKKYLIKKQKKRVNLTNLQNLRYRS